jgi:dienelactone hydrolase
VAGKGFRVRGAAIVALVVTVGGCAPAAPPADGPSAGIPAADGVSLRGHVFGSGTTAVVLSNMGDNDPGPWEQFAPQLARRGYTVLTYSFRYPLLTHTFFSPTNAVQTVPDLAGAVTYVRSRGARHVVLVGASLGGITTGKVAASTHPDAVVIMAAEQDLAGYDLAVSPTELAQLTQPKLFVASEQDTNTPYAAVKAYFDHAPPPKQFAPFPGSDHGVRLFTTGHGDALRTLLLDFITTNAGPDR